MEIDWLLIIVLAPMIGVAAPFVFYFGFRCARWLKAWRLYRKPPTVPPGMADSTSTLSMLPGDVTYVDSRHGFRSLGEERLFYRGEPIDCFMCSVGEKCEKHPT